jgi:hypothetical protein
VPPVVPELVLDDWSGLVLDCGVAVLEPLLLVVPMVLEPV